MKINQELINKLKNGEIAIDNQGNPNVELLRAVLKEAFPTDIYTPKGKFIYYYKATNSEIFLSNDKTNLPTIPLNDFLEKEQFPKDDFGVIVENNNGKEIIDYLVSKGFVNSLALDGDGTRKYQIGKNSLVIRYETIDTSKTYTLQQLKNLENNMENKEIIGYKLIKPEYEEVAAKICSSSATKLYGNVGAPSDILKLKTAGVLDIWFEPVYKSKEIVIRMGDKFDLTIKDGKVIHINEDITGYVHGIYMQFSTFQNNWKFGDAKSYDFQIKDVIISKSGCQNTETKLSEWILVYNESQKQK